MHGQEIRLQRGSRMNIREELFALQDLKYKDFQGKLMPTVDPDTIIGVRTNPCLPPPADQPVRPEPYSARHRGAG